jgi:lipid A 3-O-deacylase
MHAAAALLLGVTLVAGSAFAGEPEIGLVLGRGDRSQETEVVRLGYRQALDVDEARSRWWPGQLQYAVGIWRVPDLRGETRRYDFSVTPVWRGESALGNALRGYVEAGFGAYLLSRTINNHTNRLPSAFQFGSHLGAGVAFGEGNAVRLGIAIQHLSNAGLKEPNGGINLYLLTASLRL